MRSTDGCSSCTVSRCLPVLAIILISSMTLFADTEKVPSYPQNGADSIRADTLGAAGFGNRVFDLGAIVVTAIRTEESSFRLPVIAQSLGAQSVLMRQMSRTLPEALKEMPAVSVQKTSNFAFSAALENVTDRAYRIHGSGQNEAGRNAVVATRLSL